VTLNNVLQAALIGFTAITSVSALAIALFGSAAALERWLDSPSTGPTRPRVAAAARNLDASLIDDSAGQTQAA
jgi:hypothetical protein